MLLLAQTSMPCSGDI